MKKYVFVFFLLLTGFNRLHAQEKKSYTLEDCVNRAVEMNISIKRAQLDMESSAIDKADAIGNFLPTFNLQGSHSWNIGLNQNITTGLLENVTTQFSSMSANVNTSIYNGLRNVRQLHFANLNILAREYQLKDMTEDVMLLVANAYLQVNFSRELLKLRQDQREVTLQELSRTQALIDQGVLRVGDIYEIEANLASQEQAIVNEENNLRLAKINLAQLLLIEDYSTFELAEEDFDIPISEVLLENPKTIFETALQNRNDIKLALTNIEIAETNVLLSKSALQPRLSAFYSYSTRLSYSDRLVPTGTLTEIPIGYVAGTLQEVRTLRSETAVAPPLDLLDQLSLNDGHNFGLALNIPVFNGKSAQNNLKRSQINVLQSQQLFEQQKIDLETTVNQAYNNAKGAYKFYEANQKTVVARQDAMDNAKKRYEAGVMNSFDYVQAKQRFETAVSDLVRAKYDYVFKLKVLEFYFGIPIR
ncbi:MAG: TolC family protein [Flavobacteriaceae bacterium]